ncbi:MAG: DUF423 domain-containing protein [Planctomycetes bacterium]|nr:DUF423 domain-containing protein [Planctomycetota bacterium]
MCSRTIVTTAALVAAAAVAFGAYAAHGLTGRLETLGYAAELRVRVGWFETGAKYQMSHALAALLAMALTPRAISLKTSRLASAAFFLGILLFSGSLYVMTFAPAEWKKLGAITPLGGLSFIIGWLIIAFGACRNKPSE